MNPLTQAILENQTPDLATYLFPILLVWGVVYVIRGVR